MRRLETQPLEGFNQTLIDQPTVFEVEVNGRAITYDTLVGNTPAVTSDYDGLTDPQLVLGSEDGLPPWDEKALFPVGRLDRIHGRTLEVLGDRVLVRDKFGNEYTSLNIKGCDLSNPYLFKTSTAAREYIIRGLQESLVMERVLKASQVLREHEVGAEYICGLVLPKGFPVDQERRAIDHKEIKQLPEFLEYLASRFATTHESDESPLAVKAEMIERFSDCDYLITYRAMDCPYRLGELSDNQKFADFKNYVAKNYAETWLPEFIEKQDQAEYLRTAFPYLMAHNVANMHKAGLKHGFLVELNVSAMGSIVDLDSCRGEPLDLGDEAITLQDQVVDVATCLMAVRKVIRSTELDDQPPYPFSVYHKIKAIHEAQFSFLDVYLSSRFEQPDDKTDFLAALLTYEMDKEDQLHDGLWLYTLSESTHGVYRGHRGHPDLPKVVTPSLNLRIAHGEELDLKRHTSFLRSLPPKFFQDMKDQILDDSWTRNHEFPQLKNRKKPSYPTIKPLIKNHFLKQLANQYKQGNIESSADFLYVVGCAFNRLKPRRPDRQLVVENTKKYYRAQTAAILDRLGEYDEDAIGDELRPYLEQLGPLKEQIGQVDVTAPDRPSMDILYLKDEAQYAQALDAFNLSGDTPIASLRPSTIFDLSSRDGTLVSDAFIIADYKTAHAVADQTTSTDVIEKVFGWRGDAKPLVIVSGLSSGQPHVYFHPVTLLMDESELLTTYEQLKNRLLSIAGEAKEPAQPALFSLPD